MRDVCSRLSKAPEETSLVIDGTGVGAAVVDMFRERVRLDVPHASEHVHSVHITGGVNESRDGNNWNVPKRNLVGVVQVLLQGRRLRVNAETPEAETLARELMNFRMKINPETAHDSYSAGRENEHDDLVLSVAVGAWAAVHPGIPMSVPVCAPASGMTRRSPWSLGGMNFRDHP